MNTYAESHLFQGVPGMALVAAFRDLPRTNNTNSLVTGTGEWVRVPQSQDQEHRPPSSNLPQDLEQVALPRAQFTCLPTEGFSSDDL